MKTSFVLLLASISSFAQINIQSTENAGVTISPKGIHSNFKSAQNPDTENLVLGSEAYTSDFLYVANKSKGNVALGSYAMSLINLNAAKYTYNTVVGYRAMHGYPSTIDSLGQKNVVLGAKSMEFLIEGDENVAVGFEALRGIARGSGNTAVGHLAGRDLSFYGEKNVLIGYRAGGSGVKNNKLYIANSNTEDALIKGDFATSELKINGKLKIGGSSDTPEAQLEVAGNYAISAKLDLNNSFPTTLNNFDIQQKSVVKVTGQKVISGIAGGRDGLIVHFYLNPGSDLEIKFNSTLSSISNRIHWSGNINTPNIVMLSGGALSLIYDGPEGGGFWRVLSLFKP